VGFYCDRIVPRIVNAACGMNTTRTLRRRVCAGLIGEVIEVGFGSGLNVPFYPPGVIRVDAVEPADLGWKLAGRRVAASSVPCGAPVWMASRWSFADDSYDAALCTWTLCTIPDVTAALAEVRRVLKLGGCLHFVEHGLAPDERVRRWQRRLDPVQKKIAGGCHLTRPVVPLLVSAGFTITDLDVFYDRHAPRVLGALTLGTARCA